MPMRKTRKQIGGGPWHTFLLEKSSEIPDQAKLFFRSGEKGHGLTTLASIGNWIHTYGTAPTLQTVPLSKIILWHPVRGASERKNAGEKTTRRKEAVNAYFRTVNTSEPIHLTEPVLTTIPNMGSSDPMSAIKVTPLLSDVRKFVKHATKKPTYSMPTRAVIANLLRTINERKATLTTRALGNVEPSKTTRKRFTKLHYYDDIRALPHIISSDPFYIVSSGQGRLQAIKEAILETGVDPDNVLIDLIVYNVPRNLCSLFLITGNEYRKDGFFANDRHILDNKLLPSAESCYKDSTRPEDILSLYHEVAADDDPSVFNTETFVEGNYQNDAAGGTIISSLRQMRKSATSTGTAALCTGTAALCKGTAAVGRGIATLGRGIAALSRGIVAGGTGTAAGGAGTGGSARLRFTRRRARTT